MPKAFLSHSSSDKEFVTQVALNIGLNNCEMDQYNFEVGLRNIDEIFKSIDKSDVFVFFISDASLNSKWVQQELNYADTKITAFSSQKMQIFPIIIDSSIKYNDPRIPAFMRDGYNSYNIRHITSPIIAARKIHFQQIKLVMDTNPEYEKRENFFYGRDIEKKEFKYQVDDIINKEIKCAVVSGVPGIGRKAFINAALIDAHITERYYRPMVISTSRDQSIDDVLRSIANLGVVSYSISQLSDLHNIDEKIHVLANMLSELQTYNELLVIDDNECLVRSNGEIVYWFSKALNQIKSSLCVLVVCLNAIDYMRLHDKKYYANITLAELTSTESIGMLRAYASLFNLQLERDDLEFFYNCLSGYPPQIKYCVELIKEQGLHYAKSNSDLISKMPEQTSARLLDIACEAGVSRSIMESLLAVIAKFITLPISLLDDIFKSNSAYKDAFYRLRSLSICGYIGDDQDYIKLNPIIQTYVCRCKFKISSDINEMIMFRMNHFLTNINNGHIEDNLDYYELSAYIIDSIKNGKPIPERLCYGSLFSQSIISLYNEGKYKKIISIIKSALERDQLNAYEKESEDRIRYYYCLALARLHDPDFDMEVLYFKDKPTNYYFLQGFQNRRLKKYKNAEELYKKVLTFSPNHMIAKRELVYIYVETQRYEDAKDYAKLNYRHDRNNIHNMEAYFDCLSREVQQKLSADEINDLAEIIDNAQSISKQISKDTKDSTMVYEILAKHAAFIENDLEKSINFIQNGINKNQGYNLSYIYRDMFDIYEHFYDISGMESALNQFEKTMNSNDFDQKQISSMIFSRRILLLAYQKKPLHLIQTELQNNYDLSDHTKSRLENKIKQILNVK